MSRSSPDETGAPVCYRHPDRESYIRCQRCGRSICPDCMHTAAVGFQCPECVAEGRRTQRAPRTPYGGRIGGRPGLTTEILIGINVAVWVLITVTGGSESIWVSRLALLPETVIWAPGVIATGVADGAYWQLVTSMFTHVAVLHIGFNMLALWLFGPQLERILGRSRYLGLYLLSGLIGSALVYWLAPVNAPTIGASGAIFGLLGAYLVVALRVGGNVRALLVILGINFVITFTIPGISWAGHVGGFLGGAAIAALLVFAPRRRRAAWHLAGMLLVAVGIAVAVAARTAVLP